MKKFVSILFTLVVVVISVSFCTPVDYIFHAHTYPPDSDPTSSDWEYMIKVVAKTRGGSFNAKSVKNINVNIINRDKENLLDENYAFECVSTQALFKWEKVENVEVLLFDITNFFDPEELLSLYKNDKANLIFSNVYHLDSKTGKYSKVRSQK